MAERERRTTPPYGGVFVARTRVMDADDIRRAIWRMAHEIVERNHGVEDVVLVGLQTGGVGWPRPSPRPSRRSTATRRRSAPSTSPCYRDDIGVRPVLPEAVTEIAFDLDGAHGRAGRRRALHRPHDPGRPRRPPRLRPAPGGAARRDGRPGPPGAADPARLRRQEPADPPRRGGQRQRRRASTSARWSSRERTCSRSPTSGRDEIEEVLRLTDTFVEVSAGADPEGAGAAGQDRRVALLRGLHPHPAVLRDGGQAPVGRHHDLQRRHVVGEEGRVAARHRPDHRGHGHRRHRRAPRLGRRALAGRRLARRPGAASSTPATAGTSTPPRRCSTATRSASTAATLDGLRIAIVGDVKHSRVARSDVLAYTALGAEVTLVAPPTLLPPEPRGLAGPGQPRPRRGAARASTSSACCACSASG